MRNSHQDRQKLARIAKLHSTALRLTARGEYRAADTMFRSALRHIHHAARRHATLRAALLNDYAVLCKYTGRFALAQRMYRLALNLIVRLNRRADYKDAIATLHHNLGGIAFARRRYAEAQRLARRGFNIRKSIRPRDALALAADEAALAAILAECGRTSDAATMCLHALRTFRRKLGPHHYEVGAALANLGALYWKTKRPKAAHRALRRSVSILEAALGKKHPRTTSAVSNLAFVCAALDRNQRAAVLRPGRERSGARTARPG
jgi:tetratricopeptide (TPR) repeat protein